MYKVLLDDGRFIFLRDNDRMTLFHSQTGEMVVITCGEYGNSYKDYVFCEVGCQYKKVGFSLQYHEQTDFPVGTLLKNVSSIVDGDILLGPDGKASIVSNCHSFEADGYEVFFNGKTHVVDKDHILRLVIDSEEINMPINVFLHMDDSFKQSCRIKEVL